MAQLGNLGLDPNVPESNGEFTVLPAGKYEMVIKQDVLKDNSKRTGKLLELTLEVIKGEYSGTEIIDRLNIINPSDVAQKIGQGTLKRICNLCGVPFPPDDSRKLWGIPIMVKVKVTEFESNTTGEKLQSNKVTSYSQVNDVSASYGREEMTQSAESRMDDEW